VSDTEMCEVATLALQASEKQRETTTSHVQAPLRSTGCPSAEPRCDTQRAQRDRLLPQTALHGGNAVRRGNAASGGHAWRCVEINSREGLRCNDLHHRRILLLISPTSQEKL